MDNTTSLSEVFNKIDSLIGDKSVSEQLSAALNRMADKNHTHNIYATCEEVAALKKEIEKLIDLVGDIPVSEQISNAAEKITPTWIDY